MKGEQQRPGRIFTHVAQQHNRRDVHRTRNMDSFLTCQCQESSLIRFNLSSTLETGQDHGLKWLCAEKRGIGETLTFSQMGIDRSMDTSGPLASEAMWTTCAQAKKSSLPQTLGKQKRREEAKVAESRKTHTAMRASKLNNEQQSKRVGGIFWT